MNKLRADYRTAMLGAFAGLFSISVFLLVDRVDMYYEYLARPSVESYDVHINMTGGLWWMPVVFWHVLMFVLASFVVHRHFADISDSPFLLWQLVGIGALCAWGLSALSVVTLDALMYGRGFDFVRLTSDSNLYFVAKFFAVVLAANVACASFLHSAARQYAHGGGQ